MSKPTLSIIIPVWNTSDNVRHIISAILAQPFKEFELILVDDGSTDDTLSVLKAIAKTDKRIHVFTKPNGGPSSARNFGLERATGEYIQFYDSDDNIADNALTLMTSAITENHSDLVVSGWQIDLQSPKGLIKSYKQVQPQAEIISDNIPRYVLRSLGNNGTLYNLWNKMFRADIIRNNELRFREDLRFGEDLLFSLEYFKYVHTLHIIPDITYHYQTNSGTSVFASSSLIPEYRIANDEAIVTFAGNDRSTEKDSLLQWLRWRWLMSYWSLVAGSKKAFSEKRKLINAFQPKQLYVVYSLEYLGFKKILIQVIANVCRRSSYLALCMGWMFGITKRVIIGAKSLIKRILPR